MNATAEGLHKLNTMEDGEEVRATIRSVFFYPGYNDTKSADVKLLLELPGGGEGSLYLKAGQGWAAADDRCSVTHFKGRTEFGAGTQIGAFLKTLAAAGAAKYWALNEHAMGLESDLFPRLCDLDVTIKRTQQKLTKPFKASDGKVYTTGKRWVVTEFHGVVPREVEGDSSPKEPQLDAVLREELRLAASLGRPAYLAKVSEVMQANPDYASGEIGDWLMGDAFSALADEEVPF